MVKRLDLKIKTKLPIDLGKMHFIGIGGIGMSGIAELIHNLGYDVSGSDLKNTPIVDRLIKLGIEVRIGHNIQNIKETAIVVISSAVGPKNIELIEEGIKRAFNNVNGFCFINFIKSIYFRSILLKHDSNIFNRIRPYSPSLKPD